MTRFKMTGRPKNEKILESSIHQGKWPNKDMFITNKFKLINIMFEKRQGLKERETMAKFRPTKIAFSSE